MVLVFIAAGAAAAGADLPRVRLGGLVVGAGYSSGPRWYPRYGLYDPWWYSPYIHPGLYTSFVQQADMGQVKLQSPDKDALVYLDGAYAGSAQKLKSFWLAPGVYSLELRDEKQRVFRQRIYVLTGKTLALQPKLQHEETK
ncbi:MAG: PEGA domain-containing protein [Bryobacteraceae bacterium]